MQAPDAEAVLAQRQDHVRAQAAPAERGPQRQPEVSRPVVQVNGPQQGRAGQLAAGRFTTGQLIGGQFHHGEQGKIVAGLADRVGRRGRAG